MAINDVLKQLQGLIQGTAPKLIQTTDQLRQALPFLPGERYTAQVQEHIANGRFLVTIRDQKLDLNLPRNTQPGQNVELRFVTNEPRPTFVLAEAAQTQARTPVNLSDGARYLNSLLDRVQNLAQQARQTQGAGEFRQAAGQPAAHAATAQTTHGTTLAKALFDGAPPPTPQFAVMLKDTVAKSGLFYESHQAQWVAGDRPMADLLREPQGKLSEARAFAQAQQPADLGRPPRADTGAASLPTSASQVGTVPEPVHPRTAPLVQQQLETLDTRQMLWQGQVWPGQEMHWRIEEREAREQRQGDTREWATSLNLTLPILGEVSALLRFTPAGIAVSLRAGDEAASRLRDAVPLLVQGMQNARLDVAQVTVDENG